MEDTVVESVKVKDEDDREEFAEILREIRELKNTKLFLKSENERYRTQVESLSGELDGLSISISSAEAYSKSYNNRKKKCIENISTLKSKKETLIRKVSKFHDEIKRIQDDEKATRNLHEKLKGELNEIFDEKSIVMGRIKDVKKGLKKINLEKKVKAPNIKNCDNVLKQVHTSLKKIQNKMEVSMLFKRSN
uniref:Magnetosome protein Mad26 n=1 Tax=Candidatus Magnetananas rongchengensis TaxID=1463558 RepID=A0A3Q8B4N8_9BACT|nr:magnetosome protein Mad26 [Candidatus Magnetananas rongchenensis]